jgi:hypothetical protein
MPPLPSFIIGYLVPDILFRERSPASVDPRPPDDAQVQRSPVFMTRGIDRLTVNRLAQLGFGGPSARISSHLLKGRYVRIYGRRPEADAGKWFAPLKHQVREGQL